MCVGNHMLYKESPGFGRGLSYSICLSGRVMVGSGGTGVSVKCGAGH